MSGFKNNFDNLDYNTCQKLLLIYKSVLQDIKLY